ncbi:MAG: ribosome biogenesis GTP-binding protein YihA/YsxC [Arenicellales bacterium]|nr:ribosome biogenesis GTP-binding protein YihA/YsxC [Arenicellales bacterium]
MTAAHTPDQWPPDRGSEVAFVGRSNVGKSSAINAITQRKALARTSRSPGRTQQIVFFQLPGERRLVDLPGYGYAKVPAKLRNHWASTIEKYINTRAALRGLIMLMDSRHPLTELDRKMLHWCSSAELSTYVLLTKIDKLSRNQMISTQRSVNKETVPLGDVTVQPFSAVDGTGVKEARCQIVTWLE